MDSYFDAAFFTEFELFDDWHKNLHWPQKDINYVSICSPNYLHKAHISFTLRAGADAICKKPLLPDPSGIDELIALETETGQRVNSIPQLRLHHSIIVSGEKIANGPKIKFTMSISDILLLGVGL